MPTQFTFPLCFLLILHSPFLTCLVSLSFTSGYPTTLKIGALLDFNDTVGQAAKVAIQLAVDDVNNSHDILNGTQLELKSFDSGSDPVVGAAAGVELLKQEVVAIVGPQTSNVAQFVSHLGRHAQVPMVSFGATDPNLSEMQYPYLIRTVPSDAIQMEAVAAFIANYRWKEVVVLYMDDDYGANGASVLSDSLQKRGGKLVQKVALVPWIDTHGIEAELSNLANMQTRVFVLHLHHGLGFQILQKAKVLHMLESDYVWIATDLITTGLENLNLPPDVVKSTQGIICTTRYIPPSSKLQKLVEELGKRFPTQFRSIDPGQISPYVFSAYDAVWAIAYAISSYLKQQRAFSFRKPPELSSASGAPSELAHINIFEGGPTLRDIILQEKFLGTSGLIQFDYTGDIDNATFVYMNMVGRSPHQVGYWGSQIGVSLSPNFQTTPAANSTKLPIVWPGETTETPQGWVLPRNGTPLRIGVPRKAGYTELVSQTVGPNNVTVFSGFCIQVFEAALKYLPYALPHQFIPFGNGTSTPQYDELVLRMANKEYDGVVGDVAVLAERLKIADFTQPYIESGLVVLIPLKNNRKNSALAFLRPFTTTLWCTVLGFFLFTGLVIWILEHRVNDDFRGSRQKQVIVVLSFIFSTLFFAHKEDTRSFLGRVVLLMWLFVILIINSSYTANLTSILTVQQLNPGINGLDSLLQENVPIGYQTGSFVRAYLISLGVSPSRLKDLSSREMYRRALDAGPNRGGVAAIVDELPYVQLFQAPNCNNYTIAGQEFTKSGWGFAFPRGSDITADLSEAILQMSQNGELARLREYWFKQRECEQETLNSEVQSNQLDVKSFWGLFLVSGVASVVCLAIYLARLLKMYRQYQQQQVVTNGSRGRVMDHLKQFLRFADKAKPKKGPKADSSKDRPHCLSTTATSPSTSTSISTSTSTSTSMQTLSSTIDLPKLFSTEYLHSTLNSH